MQTLQLEDIYLRFTWLIYDLYHVCLLTLVYLILKFVQDESDGSVTPGPNTPRTTGSLLAHSNDDVVTRMKNIEMIELGKHRIKPCYFAPYPQVNNYFNLYIYNIKSLSLYFKIQSFMII